MQLDEFLTKNSISSSDFAKKIRAKSRGTVCRYRNKTRIPNPEMMERIAIATNGQVMANDFHNIKLSKHKSFKPSLQLPTSP